MKFLNEKSVITKKAEVLKESSEYADRGPGVYTVSVSYLATINVKVEADNEDEAIDIANRKTGIEPSFGDDCFIVEAGDLDVEGLDYGDSPYTDSYVIDYEPYEDDEIIDEDEEDDEDPEEGMHY